MRRYVSVTVASCAVWAAAAGAAGDMPPTLIEACGDYSNVRALSARSFWQETRDGVRLYMIEAGSGKTTAVLAHGGQSNLCETLTFATKLVAAGYKVVAIDLRGRTGHSGSSLSRPLSLGRDLAAAVAHARQAGDQTRLLDRLLDGRSGNRPEHRGAHVEGRISLSGTRLWRGYGINNPAGVARIRAPFLYIGSRNDWRAPLKEALEIFRRVGAADKRTAFYPGSFHGWELVENPRFASQTRALILRRIANHAK